MTRRVVVTGVGLVSAVGIGTEETWRSLLAGRSGVAPITHFDTTGFSATIAAEVKGFDPLQFVEKKELKRMGLFIQFALAATQFAMEQAQLKVAPDFADRVGVYIGSGIGGFDVIEREHTALMQGGPRKISPFFIPAAIVNLASGFVSIRWGAKGPNSATCTACSSSTHAVGDSFKLIQRCAADVMICGGAEAAITPIVDTFEEFNRLYKCATPVTPEWLNTYKEIYKKQHEIERRVVDKFEENSIAPVRPIIPNKMQRSALESLRLLRSEGCKKALLISATGTGKTYLSTFDVNLVNPRRFLFVVHRENIATAVMKSFKKIFGESKKMGILTGSEKDFGAEYIFSTIQTLSKPEILKKFSPDYFDYIVIDEVHRSGAKSYRTILEYFNPNFLLGMTATPERTDGYDIFKAFDYNIAFEIRLHTALEEDMLSPFHYYGITDISVDGKLLDNYTEFNNLVSNERVERIIENSKFYGCDRGRIKGLIFCSRVEEAKKISEKLNLKGYQTIALSGKNGEKERDACIERLESDDREDYLDYILTVDIFNEGVDIPSVNYIIMLRPTQSAIVFV